MNGPSNGLGNCPSCNGYGRVPAIGKLYCDCPDCNHGNYYGSAFRCEECKEWRTEAGVCYGCKNSVD